MCVNILIHVLSSHADRYVNILIHVLSSHADRYVVF